MQIRRVTLRNVKSYELAEIPFQPGINFVCGENGAGKTTIIEAVGYCLFGYLPYNLAEFVRNGRGKGAVEVTFTARDGCDYQVTREFDGKTSKSPRVSDGSGGVVDLHGNADYETWFRMTVGLEPDVSPKQLFEQVLGVSQGTFAAPFLQSAGVRRSVFDGLFRVNSFRQAHNGALPGVNALRDRIVALEKDEALVAQRLEPLPQVEQELSDVRSASASAQSDLAATTAALVTSEHEAANLKLLADEVTAAEKRSVALTGEAQATADREARLKQDIARSDDARQKVEASRAAHERYLSLAAAISDCEARVADQAAHEQTLQTAEKQLADLSARSEQGEAAHAQREAELAAQRAALADQAAAAESELAAAQVRAGAVGEQRMLLQNAMNAKETVARVARVASSAAAAAGGTAERAISISERIAELGGRLAARDRLAASAATLPEREARLRRIQVELAQARERRKLLDGNRAKAADGLCPFLAVECPTAGVGLAARFDDELAALANEESSLAALVVGADGDVKEAMLAGRDLAALETVSAELQRAAADLERGDEKARGAAAGLSVAAGTLGALAESLSPTAAIDADPAAQATLSEALTIVRESTDAVSAPMNGSATAAQATAWIRNIQTALESAERAAAAALAALDSWLVSSHNEATGAVRSAATKLAGLGQQQRTADAAAAKLASERSELDGLAARRVSLAAECERLAKLISAYGNPRAELAGLREQQATDAPAHETFIRHLPDAERLPSLQAEMIAVSQSRTAVLAEQAAVAARLVELQRQYAPERLADLERTVRSQHARIAGLEQQITDLTAREQGLVKQIADLQALRARQAALAGDLVRHREAMALLEAARQVLNSAGEPVAEHFRRQVAADADRIQRKVAGDAAALVWDKDYEVALTDASGGTPRRRVFAQLSGGEQMTVALALRIALLRFLSPIRVGFFDEPTVNLDTGRRANLATMLRSLSGEVGQLFLISHDDTFDSITENVTYLQKAAGVTVVREEAAR